MFFLFYVKISTLFDDSYKISNKSSTMNKAILQIWEESIIDDNILPIGGTLHIDVNERNKYVNHIYNNRDINMIPDNYDRISGSEVEVLITNSIFNILLERKTVKLEEYELNNLVNMKEIILEND